MSMSTSVYGIKPPDEKWEQMKKIHDACRAAKVRVPNEVEEFFGFGTPDKKGVVVDLDDERCVTRFSDEMANSFEVDLTKLPPDVKIIRFTNSY